MNFDEEWERIVAKFAKLEKKIWDNTDYQKLMIYQQMLFWKSKYSRILKMIVQNFVLKIKMNYNILTFAIFVNIRFSN